MDLYQSIKKIAIELPFLGDWRKSELIRTIFATNGEPLFNCSYIKSYFDRDTFQKRSSRAVLQDLTPFLTQTKGEERLSAPIIMASITIASRRNWSQVPPYRVTCKITRCE